MFDRCSWFLDTNDGDQLMIAALLLAFPTSGYGPVCAVIDDRDGDGRSELVMSTAFYSKSARLLVWSSNTHQVLSEITPSDRSLAFGSDILRIDGGPTGDRLLVGDPFRKNSEGQGEGAVYRLDEGLKIVGVMAAQPGEQSFGSRLYASSVQDGDQLLAVQTYVLKDPKNPYSGREHFAIYSLRNHERSGIIAGSSKDAGSRCAFEVCAWTPDCDGDGVPDLAIDMMDSVVLYSGKTLQPIRTLSYAKQVTADQYFGRSLSCIRLHDGSHALLTGLPAWFAFPDTSLLLSWPLEKGDDAHRIENPGCGCGFGSAVCQTSHGDVFVTSFSAFEAGLAFSKEGAPDKFNMVMTASDETILMGSVLRCIGDWDGDGVEDVAVTRANAEMPGGSGQGLVLVSGKTRSVIGRIELDEKSRYVYR